MLWGGSYLSPLLSKPLAIGSSFVLTGLEPHVQHTMPTPMESPVMPIVIGSIVGMFY